MKGLLVRVGADQGEGGGWWNAPVNSITREFAYVPIPETGRIRQGFATPYNLIVNGDIGEPGHRGAQINDKLCRGDLLVFYGSFRDVNPNPQLVYAIVGLYVIDSVIPAVSIPASHWNENAHTRRVLSRTARDIVVTAKPKVSGRLKIYIPIGEYRNRAYRVKRALLNAWGELTVKDGFLQRSARLPAFREAAKFYEWFLGNNPSLVQKNN
jgi:hypothetical protein